MKYFCVGTPENPGFSYSSLDTLLQPVSDKSSPVVKQSARGENISHRSQDVRVGHIGPYLYQLGQFRVHFLLAKCTDQLILRIV